MGGYGTAGEQPERLQATVDRAERNLGYSLLFSVCHIDGRESDKLISYHHEQALLSAQRIADDYDTAQRGMRNCLEQAGLLRFSGYKLCIIGNLLLFLNIYYQ